MLKKTFDGLLMKKTIIALCFFSAPAIWAVDYSGNYDCTMYDQTDGYFTGQLTLKINPLASLVQQGYGSYDVHMSFENIPYEYDGYAAAHGSQLAIYFESVGAKRDPDDKGVGIASVVLEKDANNKDIISIHKFYYTQQYHNKSTIGFQKCVKTTPIGLSKR